jgi:putative CocE/NonD family hydrolase
MKMKKRKQITFLAILVLMIGLIISGAPRLVLSESGIEKISRPFEYLGYTFPDHKSYVKWSEYVSMYDGAKLAVDVYLPQDGPTNGPFPVLFAYLPYKRSTIDPATGAITGPYPYGPTHMTMIQTFTKYGYAVVVADMRGSGASFGSKPIDMSPQLGIDGKELIDWIESQPWCDGNVGMYGGSYLGWAQLAVAGQSPRALKAIMPETMGFDMFSAGMFHPGGVYNAGLVNLLGYLVTLMDEDAYIPTAGLLLATPVIDEDGDGKLADEIPMDLNGNGLFIDDPPTYSDGKNRQNIYYNAIREHLNNLDFRQWVPNAPYRDSNIAGLGYTYTDIGPSDWPVHMVESGIAIYNGGAWFDIFTLGTTRWYATMQATNPSKMLMHPSFHSSPDMVPRFLPYWTYFGLDIANAGSRYTMERLRFFDRYLKGIKNGIDAEPPIFIYVMNGEGWRFEDKWPLTRQVVADYYFKEGNALQKVRTSNGSDKYVGDFTTSSTYGANGATRWIPRAVPDDVLKRTDKDLKCLTYTSEPLEQDTEVTGHPIADLWVSSTADNGDFFVYLEDVDEKGEAYYVTEGFLRAGFQSIVPPEDILPPGANIDVKPDLPYHGFKKADYVDKIFANDKKVELTFDLMATSWVFKKGHRIRVSIAVADWPTFDLHPKLSPANNPQDPNNIVPTITVYRDAKHHSRIKLPIIPPKPTVFQGAAKIHTRHGRYEVSAELYTFRDDIYLHYEDQWVKWNVIDHSEKKHMESFECGGDFGKLFVVVHQERDNSYIVHANGQKISFEGTAK